MDPLTKDPMMQPCRRGCGELVHLENDGFHVCREQPSSKPRNELPHLLREAERRVNAHVFRRPGDSALASIPANHDRDVDLLLLEAADEIERLRDENELLKDACGCQNGAIERLTRELAAEKQSADYAWKNTRELDAERMKWGKALQEILTGRQPSGHAVDAQHVAYEALRGADEPEAGPPPCEKCGAPKVRVSHDTWRYGCEHGVAQETSAAHKPGCWKLHSPSGNGKCNCGAEREEPNE